MRQILFGEQWFHPEAPAEVVEIFNRLGRKRTFKKGEELKHGAPDGEITLLLTGLCLYRFWDTQDKEHVLSLILPNRTMGDIDGLTGTMANVSAYTIKTVQGWSCLTMSGTKRLEKTLMSTKRLPKTLHLSRKATLRRSLPASPWILTTGFVLSSIL